MAQGFQFDKIITNLNRVKSEVPRKVANVTLNYFVRSWAKQGFDNHSWLPRKMETPKSQGKAILVGTGKLRRAVQGSLRLATWDKIQFVVDLPYAGVHNYGLSAGRGKGFTMPQRKFMGDGKELRDIQVKEYVRALNKIWKV